LSPVVATVTPLVVPQDDRAFLLAVQKPQVVDSGNAYRYDYNVKCYSVADMDDAPLTCAQLASTGASAVGEVATGNLPLRYSKVSVNVTGFEESAVDCYVTVSGPTGKIFKCSYAGRGGGSGPSPPPALYVAARDVNNHGIVYSCPISASAQLDCTQVATLTTDVSSDPTSIFITGNTAYVGDGFGKLFQCSMTTTPWTCIRAVDCDDYSCGEVSGVWVVGTMLYFVDNSYGYVNMCDTTASTPWTTACTDVANSIGTPFAIDIVGTKSYTTDVGNGGNVYECDIPNPPGSWSRNGVVAGPGLGRPYGIAIDGTNAYVPDNNGGILYECDMTQTPWNCNAVVSSGLGSPYGIAIDGTTAYIADDDNTNGSVIGCDMTTWTCQSVSATIISPRALAIA
jgi:hypothetical protein